MNAIMDNFWESSSLKKWRRFKETKCKEPLNPCNESIYIRNDEEEKENDDDNGEEGLNDDNGEDELYDDNGEEDLYDDGG